MENQILYTDPVYHILSPHVLAEGHIWATHDHLMLKTKIKNPSFLSILLELLGFTSIKSIRNFKLKYDEISQISLERLGHLRWLYIYDVKGEIHKLILYEKSECDWRHFVNDMKRSKN